MFNDFFNKNKAGSLKSALGKTASLLWHRFTGLMRKPIVDQSFWDDLESIMIESDFGYEVASKIVEVVKDKAKISKEYSEPSDLVNAVKKEILRLLIESSANNAKIRKEEFPKVIIVVGINGVGKTTTVAKLAYYYKQQNKKVIIGAADTYRAAAVDQLKIWGQRIGIDVIAGSVKADPASVSYDAVKAGLSCDADVIIVDTAGRLHNKVNLMRELTKIKKTVLNLAPNANHEICLVLDGNTGQNAISQAESFESAVEATYLIVTKLDGTSKGGVVVGISSSFGIPIEFIGIGENIDDLQLFDPHAFVETLFDHTSTIS